MTPKPTNLDIFVDGAPLPIDFVTDSAAIVARKRSGKSYTAGVIVERVIAAKIPTVIFDPKGDWWGLKYTADDSGPGLPITIFGGEHEDFPIADTEGEVMADVVVDFPGYYLFDFSMWTKAARVRFVSAFIERFWIRKAPRKQHWPMFLVVDEADQFVPQRVDADMARMVGGFEIIVRQGGVRGIGSLLITQRPAVVNKNVLTQAGVFMALQITGPQDRDAALAWFEGRATKQEMAEIGSTLARLKKGEMYLYAPDLDILGRRSVRPKWTFDSGRTPKVGERLVVPKKVAAVDLERLRDVRAAAIEKKKATDPKEISKRYAARIRELEGELRSAKSARPAIETNTVEIFAVPPWLQERITGFDVQLERVRELCNTPVGEVDRLMRELKALGKDVSKLEKREDWANARGAGSGTPRAATRGRTGPPSESTGVGVRSPRPAKPASDDTANLKRSERSVLSVLAQFPVGRTHDQIAILTGYSPRASTIGVALSKLRRLGYATEGQPVRATDAGLAFIEGQYEPLPQGAELLTHWRSQLKRSEREVLDVLMDVYPDPTSLHEVAERTGYSPDASTIGVAMSKLRRLELANGWKAGDDFMEAIR